MLPNSCLAVLKSPKDDSPSCRVALSPVESSTDGSLSYDVSRYLGIQAVGLGGKSLLGGSSGRPWSPRHRLY